MLKDILVTLLVFALGALVATGICQLFVENSKSSAKIAELESKLKQQKELHEQDYIRLQRQIAELQTENWRSGLRMEMKEKQKIDEVYKAVTKEWEENVVITR